VHPTYQTFKIANLCLLPKKKNPTFSINLFTVFVQMSEKLSYLNEPLLHEWEHREFGHATDEEKVIASHPSTENTASFFGTCLNGLNAISGFIIYNT